MDSSKSRAPAEKTLSAAPAKRRLLNRFKPRPDCADYAPPSGLGQRGTRRLTTLVVVALCSGVALAGCSTADPEPAPTTPSVASAPSSSMLRPTDISRAPSDVPQQRDDGSTGTPMTGSKLTLDEAAKAEALERGVKVMTLFARRDVSAEQWLNDLVPYLTPQGAMDLRYVDPANVPPTEVTGPAELIPGAIPIYAEVSVPTNAGEYLVIMTRNDESPVWLAARILPPEGFGD